MASTLITVANTTARDALSPAVGDTVYQIDNKKINVCASIGPVVWKTYDSDGAAYLDSDITGLSPYVWLDAANEDFYTDSGKGTPANGDGNRIGCWADRSGNGLDFIEATPSYQPNVFKEIGPNNNTGVIYDSDRLKYTGSASTEFASENMVLFMALRLGQAHGNNQYIWNQGGSGTRIRLLESSGTFALNVLGFGGVTNTNGASGSCTTTYDSKISTQTNLFAFRTNSSANTLEVFLDGGSANASTTAPSSAGRFFPDGEEVNVFDESAAEAPFILYDMIVFNSSLSDANMDTVYNYLSLKYGIPVTAVS
jgi:hypothetical protein